jgi:poly(hydroxyalkanoate) granule-associated protein
VEGNVVAKPKLKSKPKANSGNQAQHKTLMDSAQQIWMAGMGALSRAQGEGTKLFETLVKEGVNLEQKTRKVATSKVDEVRGAVETTVSQVKDRAVDTWDKLEKVFEDRVSRVLNKLGVPGRGEMQALLDRVEELNKTVRKMNTGADATKAKRAAKSSVNKAKQSVTLMAEAAGDMQNAATAAVRSVAKRATRAIKKQVR